MTRWAVALLLVGCVPVPVSPPPDGPGTCETACANIVTLQLATSADECVRDCEAEDTAEAEIGVHFPKGCLTAAKTKAEAVSCR